MMRFLSSIRRLRDNIRGTAVMEFALTAPLFLLMLMGIFDFAWQMYAKQVLSGSMGHAARAATLEGNAADQNAIDAKVREAVQSVFGGAPVTFTRKSYSSFSSVGKPEDFTDSNSNGIRDTGECYVDVNGNSSWDSDRGKGGNGGADDVVLYTGSVTITRIFPVWRMLGQTQDKTVTTTTVLRNQPYNTATETSTVICT